MTPPREYFEICSSSCAGAQRIGFEWFRFNDDSALERMLTAGVFTSPQLASAECSNCGELENENEDLNGEISTLEGDLDEANETIKLLRKELEQKK